MAGLFRRSTGAIASIVETLRSSINGLLPGRLTPCSMPNDNSVLARASSLPEMTTESPGASELPETEIRRLVGEIAAGSPSAEAAWQRLRELGSAVAPYLLEAYPGARRWQGRTALVFHAIRFARVSGSRVCARLPGRWKTSPTWSATGRAWCSRIPSAPISILALHALLQHADARTPGRCRSCARRHSTPKPELFRRTRSITGGASGRSTKTTTAAIATRESSPPPTALSAVPHRGHGCAQRSHCNARCDHRSSSAPSPSLPRRAANSPRAARPLTSGSPSPWVACLFAPFVPTPDWCPLYATPFATARRVATTFFTAAPLQPYSISIYPDRTSLTDHWRVAWQFPSFQAECWLIAAAWATELDLLSPRVWSRDACGHDAGNLTHIRNVLAHEVVHVLHGQLGQHANLGSLLNAQWFTEGLAMYISGMLDVDYAGVVQARLDAGFAPRTLAEVWNDGANYPLSGSIVRYIDRRYGRAALRDLLTARSTSTILTRLGVGEAELLTAWRADPSSSAKAARQ